MLSPCAAIARGAKPVKPDAAATITASKVFFIHSPYVIVGCRLLSAVFFFKIHLLRHTTTSKVFPALLQCGSNGLTCESR
jgi:hypothetical protein